MNLGERLKEARKQRGLTQDELASKIGTSRGVITNIEYGKIKNPQPLIINTLCEVLHISRKWLLDGVGDMDNIEATKSEKVLSEIYDIAKELTEAEQIYILDVIQTYKKHLNKTESK